VIWDVHGNYDSFSNLPGAGVGPCATYHVGRLG
jgi:hypothetical protein